MSTSDELAYISADSLATRIRNRELSPVEVVEAFIDRIESRDGRINAFVHEGFEEALSTARQAEQKVASGQPVGALHGVPAAIKDLFDFKPGWPATFGGIPALRNNISSGYCTFAERIERAGAIIVGKTNSPTMGFRGTCDNLLFGPTRNPFDLRRNSGGSSGGSAAAVADGMLPFAEGTDGGGSIRIPAAWCGVFGYKASFGRIPNVSRPNAFGTTDPFLFKGPITRTVQDAALIVTAIAGYDPADPFALDEDVDLTKATRRSIDGWRVAFSPDLDVFPVEPAVHDVAVSAMAAFEEAGAEVEQVRLGIEIDQRELSDTWSRLIMPANIQALENLKAQGFDLLEEHPEQLPPAYRDWIETGLRMSVSDRLRDQRARTAVYDAFQAVFAEYDLLVTPTVPAMPVPNGEADGTTLGPTEIDGTPVDPLIGWGMAYMINFTGHPAASVPAGMHEGLPVGLQIVGGRYRDEDVIAASAAFERHRPWFDAYAAIEE